MNTKVVTAAEAVKALDKMDEYAWTTAGMNATGPRETLRKFIEQHAPADRTGDRRAECVHVEIVKKDGDFTVAPLKPSDDTLMDLARDECADFRWPSTALSIMRKAIAASKPVYTISPDDFELMKEAFEALGLARVLLDHRNAKIDPAYKKLDKRLRREIKLPKAGDSAGWKISYDSGRTWQFRDKDPSGQIGTMNAIIRPVVFGE